MWQFLQYFICQNDIQLLSRYLQLGGGFGHPLAGRRYEIVIRDLKSKDMLRFYLVLFKNATVLQKAGLMGGVHYITELYLDLVIRFVDTLQIGYFFQGFFLQNLTI